MPTLKESYDEALGAYSSFDQTRSKHDPAVDLMVATGSVGEQFGLTKPSSKGVLADSINAADRSMAGIRMSFLNTFSKFGADWAKDWSESLGAQMAANQQVYNRPIDQGFVASAVEGIVSSSPAIAASALGLGGATAAGIALVTAGRIGTAAAFSTIFAQTLGDSKDEVDQLSGGNLTPYQSWGWAMGKSLIQAGSESWFGLETRLGLGLNQAAKAITSKVAAKEGGELTLDALGRYAMGRPWVGGIKGAGLGVTKELGEEVVAGTLDAGSNQIIANESIDPASMIAEGFKQGIDAIPSVVAMVGFGSLVKTQQRQNLKNATLHGLGDNEAQKSKEDALYGQKQGDLIVVDQTLVQQENDRIQAIKQDWVDKGILKRDDADKVGELVRTVSRNIALMNRVNGSNPKAMPVEMIDTQLTSLINVDPSGREGLNNADMSELLARFKRGDSSNDILSFIIKKNPSFASTLNNILDSSQAIDVERENRTYKVHLEGRIGSKRDQAINESYAQMLSQKLSPLIDEGQPRKVFSPQETKSILPFGAFRSLYAEPLTGVKIGMGSYTAYVRGGSLILKPEFEVKETSKATTFKPLSDTGVTKQASEIESEMMAEQKKVADQITSQAQTEAGLASVEAPMTLKLRQSEQFITGQSKQAAEAEALPTPTPTSRSRLMKAYSENIRLKMAVNDYDGLEKFYNNIQAIPVEQSIKEEQQPEEKVAGTIKRDYQKEGKLIKQPVQPSIAPSTQLEEQRKKLMERISNAKNHKRPLAQMDEQLKGLYLPDYLLTIYFTGADASTIVEEWFHHITTNQLLPAEFERILTEAYGNDDEKNSGHIQSSTTHEKVAAALLNYIRSGSVNEAEVVAPFNWMRDALSQTEDNIKESTVGVDFKKLFTPVEDKTIYGRPELEQEAKEAGDIAADSMRSNPASVENFETLLEQTVKDIDDIPDDFFESDEFKGPLAQIGIPKGAGKISSEFTKKQSIKFKKIAAKLFPELGDVTSLNQLGLDSDGNYNAELHKARIAKLNAFVAQASRSINIKRAKWSDSRTTKDAERIIEEAKKELENLPDVPDGIGYAANGGPIVYQWFKQGAATVNSFAVRWLGYLDTAFHYLGLNNKDSVFVKMSDELLDSDIRAKGMDDKYAEEASKVYGSLNRFDEVELDGRSYTVDEAMGLYVFSNGQKLNFSSNEQAIRFLREKNSKDTITETEWRQLALLLSNKKRDVVTVNAMNEAVDFVKSRKDLLEIIKFTQEKMGGNHNLSKVVAKELMGIDVGTVEGLYMTFERASGAVSDDKIMAAIGQEGAEFTQRAGVGPLFTMQSRRQLEGEPLRLGYLASVDGYMARTNHFITHAEIVKKILLVLSDKGLRDSIYQKFGDVSVVNHMISQAKASLSPWGRVERSIADKVGAKIRIAISMSGIGLKPWISWLNYLSFVSSMGDMNTKMAMKNFYDTFSYVTRQSLTRKNMFGLKLSAHPLEGMEAWEDLRKLSPLIDDLSADIEQYEAMKKPVGMIDKFINKTGTARNLAELAYSFHRRADIISRFSIFKSVYELNKQRLMLENPSMKDSEATGKAVRIAEKEAIKYIPINMSSRKSYFQQSAETLRIFAPFSTQTIQYLNAYMKDYAIPFVSAYKASKDTESKRVVGALSNVATKENLRRAFWSIVVPSFIYSWLQRRRLPDEEEFLRDIVMYPIGMLPLIGSPIQSMSTYGQEEIKINPIIIFSDLERSFNAAMDIYRAATGDDEIRDYLRTLMDASAAPGDLLGIPKYLTQTTPKAIEQFVNEEDAFKASKKFLQYMMFGGESVEKKKD